MKARLTFYITTNICLSLEDYHNAGMNSEKTKEVIESINNPISTLGGKLHCRPQGINGNWNVSIGSTHPDDIGGVVDYIRYRLDCELRKITLENN